MVVVRCCWSHLRFLYVINWLSSAGADFPLVSGTATRNFLYKNCSSKFRNIHWKTPVLQSHFNKVAVKKRPQQRCFPVNIAKCLKTPILKSICHRLLRGCFFVWNPSHHSPFSPVTLTVKTENTITNWLYLKAYRQISKKWCFKKYWSCDKVCQFSAL